MGFGFAQPTFPEPFDPAQPTFPERSRREQIYNQMPPVKFQRLKTKKVEKQKSQQPKVIGFFDNIGGDGGSWTRVRQHYAHDSTCLGSVYSFSPHWTDSQVRLDESLSLNPVNQDA